MPNIPENLKVSISGVRGHCPEILSPDVAYRFVKAYSKITPQGPIVLSWDSRSSGKLLLPAILQALKEDQRPIFQIGLAPLPTTQIAVVHSKAAGGIDITASHNPAEYNGLKFLTNSGTFLEQKEVDLLRAAFEESPEYTPSDTQIQVSDMSQQATEWHLKAVLEKAIPGRRLTVAVDAVNGSGSFILPELLKRLDCDVIELANDPTQPFPHHPEPKPTNLTWTKEKLKGLDFDICLYVDPDADRLAALDENGDTFSEECLLPLMVTSLAKQGQTGVVVINQMTSQMTEAVAQGFNGLSVERSKVGEANVVAMMKETKAFFGGEGSGGLVDPTVHYGRDSLIGVVHLINLLRKDTRTISELVKSLPDFVLQKESRPVSSKESLPALYSKIKDWALIQNPEAHIDTRDGIRVSWDTTWVHIRPSNTEPIVRLFVEAPTQEIATNIINSTTKILDN
jgi:phosphomannomutase